MAAPKAGGMLFRGDLQGEPKPAGRLLGHSLGWSEKNWHGRRSRIPFAAGRSLYFPHGV